MLQVVDVGIMSDGAFKLRIPNHWENIDFKDFQWICITYGFD